MNSSAGMRPPEQDPVGGRRRVVIIDDNPATVLSLRTFLEDHGCEGLCASSAQEGLELIRRLAPDIIVLDIMMERPYSGFQICSAVKSDPTLRHIPVIGISGMAEALGIRYSPETDREFLALDAFLEKPIDMEDLWGKIQSLLPCGRE